MIEFYWEEVGCGWEHIVCSRAMLTFVGGCVGPGQNFGEFIGRPFRGGVAREFLTRADARAFVEQCVGVHAVACAGQLELAGIAAPVAAILSGTGARSAP